MVSEATNIETTVQSFLSHAVAPANVSEAVLDHDYTMLAMTRYGVGAQDFWINAISSFKRLDAMVAEPIKSFLHGDLRIFKEARRNLDFAQRNYDAVQSRYSGQARTKEPSALREDAFQLHEARKAYLKASIDLSILAPKLRTTLDKLLVRVFCDQWKDMKLSRDATSETFARFSPEMERVKGWTREMEASEQTFRRELHLTAKSIEEAAEIAIRPSRELEDYAVSTVPYLGKSGPPVMGLGPSKQANDEVSEKQGWLHLRIQVGKPTRTLWVRRWAFVKNGIFGWLIQGGRNGGVEESERIGVLLCNTRPAFQEERRFCFEVKTKNTAMMLQAETQAELLEWISVFEAAKKKALEKSSSADFLAIARGASQDPAFAISAPPAPEFAAHLPETHGLDGRDDGPTFDRAGTLPLPERDAVRSSVDVSSPRRSTGFPEEESESTREHTSRLMRKLDLHRNKPPPSPSGSNMPGTPVGGIASLIAASHSIIPIANSTPDLTKTRGGVFPGALSRESTAGSLAPSTLANPPAPTNMSKAAVIVSSERGLGVGQVDNTGGMPSGMMANLWGSTNWGFVNRLERGEVKGVEGRPRSNSIKAPAGTVDDMVTPTQTNNDISPEPSTGIKHRQTISLDGNVGDVQRALAAPSATEGFPDGYPLPLKAQDAQFRLLFPNVKREEKLVLVFRATWNPNDQQEFPGRAYVTTNDIYFYSHHLGLVLATGVSLSSIAEVTAAPGRDCDFIFLHFDQGQYDNGPNRITIKVFLEPLRLLQRRLDFLVKDARAEDPLDLSTIIQTLIKMEHEKTQRSSSMESWEDISLDIPADGSGLARTPSQRAAHELRAPIMIDRGLNLNQSRSIGKEATKFRLPAQPVSYVPQGNLDLAVEKIVDISPKALFHVLFGDRSVVWQLWLHERDAKDIKQGPWTNRGSGHLTRDFKHVAHGSGALGTSMVVSVTDYQIIDVLNDHLCYVVTDKRTPWFLPFRRSFRLVSKICITHVSKSKCKLAIFTKVEWVKEPWILKHAIEEKAKANLIQDAKDLVEMVTSQVRKLGAHSRTKKAVHVFGHIGVVQQVQSSQFPESTAADIKSDLFRPRKSISIPKLVAASVVVILQNALSFMLSGITSIFTWAWKTINAHTIILLLLFSSILINGFFSQKETMEWWRERSAGKFMARVGVKPDNVMSRAIFVRDLDDLVASTSVVSGTTDRSNASAW